MRARWFHTLPGRIGLSLVIGLLLAWLMSEGAFLILRESSDHAPHSIQLIIPLGTAERVAAGQASPSLPTDLTFVEGDTLVVKNEDVVDHQLGPVWVPPGATASLALDRAETYSVACTFQPSRVFGLDVRPRVTALTRVQAILLAGPPMAALIALYSLVIRPLPAKAAARS